jgi:hypothetical protein
MPVFFKGNYRILFIHVPKAGGTSIEAFFEANGFKTAYLDRGGSPESLNGVRRCSPQHMHAALLQALFDPDKFDYVFMTVRHPVRRLLSKVVMELGKAATVARLEQWITDNIPKVVADPLHLDNHLRPQSDFVVPGADIFKLEDGLGQPFVARLESATGLDFAQKCVPREMHARVPMPDFDLVRPDLQALVRTFYARDFAAFDYR